MMLTELIKKNRSYRRFFENETISPDTLKSWINLARLSASAANVQSLKYMAVLEEDQRAKVFSTLAWAGYLKDWDGPVEGERPSVYIIMLNDTSISDKYFCDHGIAAQSILLAAVEQGYGGCIIASVDRSALENYLGLPDHLKIIQVIALGKPKEQVVIEDAGKDGDIKYWRDDNDVHHVPKRSLEEIIIGIK